MPKPLSLQAPGPIPYFGFNDDPPVFSGTASPVQQAAAPLLATEMKANVSRFPFLWSFAENPKGTYEWGYAQPAYNAIVAAGQIPILMTGAPPAWAGGTGWNYPNNPFDFADFLVAAKAHFPQAIFQIWNEPNTPDYGNLTTAQAANLVNVAAAALSPSFVLAPGIAPAANEFPYFTGMWNLITQPNVKPAVHIYPNSQNLSIIETWIEFAQPRGPVWITEGGIHQGFNGGTDDLQVGWSHFYYGICAAHDPEALIIHRVKTSNVNQFEIDGDFGVYKLALGPGGTLQQSTLFAAYQTQRAIDLTKQSVAPALDVDKHVSLEAIVYEATIPDNLLYPGEPTYPGITATAPQVIPDDDVYPGEPTYPGIAPEDALYTIDSAQNLVTSEQAVYDIYPPGSFPQAIPSPDTLPGYVPIDVAQPLSVQFVSAKTLGPALGQESAATLSKSKHVTLPMYDVATSTTLLPGLIYPGVDTYPINQVLLTPADLVYPDDDIYPGYGGYGPVGLTPQDSTYPDDDVYPGLGPTALIFETSIAVDLSYNFAFPLATSAETDQAQSFTYTKRPTLAPVSETDAAQALRRPHIKILGSGASTNTAVALSYTKNVNVTLTSALETDAAQALVGIIQIHYVSITAAGIVHVAQPLGYSQAHLFTNIPTVELDQAQALSITHVHFRTIGTTADTETAQGLSYAKSITKTIGFVPETDVCVGLTFSKTQFKSITSVGETDTAPSIGFYNLISFSPAVESDQAQQFVHIQVHYFGLIPAVEQDGSVGLTFLHIKYRDLVPDSEFNSARPLIFTHGGGIAEPAIDFGIGTSIAEGLLLDWTKVGICFARKYVGEENVPQDIKRLRRQVYDVMRAMGTPVLIKHMFNADDVSAGRAIRSENYDSVYGQTRHSDPLSHGIGFVSVETAKDEWIMADGTLVKSIEQPKGSKPAPKYRGFGQGCLIFMIQPDAAQDVFKLDPTGALIKVQTATAQAPWYPEINDNDLIVNVEIDRAGNILDTGERYQAKVSNPISMRGWGDRFGRREYTEDGGNRHMVNQQFEMTLVPNNDQLYQVETDR